VSAERRSKVSFEIEPHGHVVKLTVIHDGFEPGSEVLESVGGGWPVVLSSLKTLLETGEPLSGGPEAPRREEPVRAENARMAENAWMVGGRVTRVASRGRLAGRCA
jgi:hypothetical protein